MTTFHKQQKSIIDFNTLKDKIYRDNNKMNMANNLLHSVDFIKNAVNTFYHNENFPLFKLSNNASGCLPKIKIIEINFLKPLKSIKKKGNFSSSKIRIKLI